MTHFFPSSSSTFPLSSAFSFFSLVFSKRSCKFSPSNTFTLASRLLLWFSALLSWTSNNAAFAVNSSTISALSGDGRFRAGRGVAVGVDIGCATRRILLLDGLGVEAWHCCCLLACSAANSFTQDGSTSTPRGRHLPRCARLSYRVRKYFTAGGNRIYVSFIKGVQWGLGDAHLRCPRASSTRAGLNI
jgi:hypothetical protein